MAHPSTIKRGASLLLQLTFRDDDNHPVDLTNLVLTSQVRDPQDDLVATLPIDSTEVEGVAMVNVPGSATAVWPLGTLRCDIKGVTAGVTSLSETFALHVERAVTQ